jgi:hypothetical protein
MKFLAVNGQNYTVNFVNNSSNSGNVMLFQTDENMEKDGVMSLAWFSKYAHPKTNVKFTWTIDYSFVWGETGELIPGVMFDASQVVSAGLDNDNRITFGFEKNGYRFKDQQKGPGGQLTIIEDKSIPLKKAAVGIGMSGAGTFVKQAQPNLNLTFTPKPKYWIAFGNYETGQILNIQEVTNSAEIKFGPNLYSIRAVLNPDNSWTINDTLSLNKKFVEAKKKGLSAIYGI